MPPALITPYTAPTRTLLHNLLAWMEPVMLLEPPRATSAGCDPDLLRAGAVKLIQVQSEAIEQDGARAELSGLLRQWEDWIAMQRGAGKLDSIKAGVSLQPPKRETVRSLMDQIKAPISGDPRVPPPPEHPPELILHLAHIRGLLAQDVEGAYSQVDQGKRKLRQSLGLDLEEGDSPELAEAAPAGEPPIDYRLMEEEGDMAPRLSAWAELLPLDQAAGALLVSGRRGRRHTGRAA